MGYMFVCNKKTITNMPILMWNNFKLELSALCVNYLQQHAEVQLDTEDLERIDYLQLYDVNLLFNVYLQFMTNNIVYVSLFGLIGVYNVLRNSQKHSFKECKQISSSIQTLYPDINITPKDNINIINSIFKCNVHNKCNLYIY